VHETTTLLLVTLPNIHRFKKKFQLTHSNKLFLIWLLATPSHLKYVATLPCNLSLMAYFADINVSRGSVATCARCGGIFNMNTWNCSLYFLLMYVKNFTSFCQVLKKMQTTENWFLFSASRCSYGSVALHSSVPVTQTTPRCEICSNRPHPCAVNATAGVRT